jgi:polyisoprenoid-binding protein YceI
MSWKIDPSHSEVTFSVRHMMISNVRGRFEKFTGVVDFNEEHPAQSVIDVQIEAASISTRDAQRDAHLRSPDFFNAEAFPYLSFKSKRIELVDAENGRLYGDLTIRDITREVVLDVTHNGSSKSPWGATVAGFSASTKINRKDWDLTWNVALETGGMLVGDAININVEIEIIKEEQAVPVSAG